MLSDAHLHEPAPTRNPIDLFIRRFNKLAHALATLAIYALASLALGIALAPSLWGLHRVWEATVGLPDWQRWPAVGVIIGTGFFVFGFCLLIVVPVFNFLLPTRVRPIRSTYYSIAAVPWYLHNALFYLVRFTFLPFVTFTPFGIWFLRAMGMKIGRNTHINTEYLSDPRLLTLGEQVAVGGSVRIFAHSGSVGHLTIAPVIIGDRVTLGLGCTVMGGVVIGPEATILAHSVVLPGSRVGKGETWGGVPARRISEEEMEAIKREVRGEGGSASLAGPQS